MTLPPDILQQQMAYQERGGDRLRLIDEECGEVIRPPAGAAHVEIEECKAPIGRNMGIGRPSIAVAQAIVCGSVGSAAMCGRMAAAAWRRNVQSASRSANAVAKPTSG